MIIDLSLTSAQLKIVGLKKSRCLDEQSLRTLFLEARSAINFHNHPIARDVLLRIAELAELCPTAFNAVPMRLVYVESPATKERIVEAVSPGNKEQTRAAPVTAIVAADLKFFRHFERLYPWRDFAQKFDGTEKTASSTYQFAWDNSLLQCAYLILAARSLGLDVGPMEGFNRAMVDAAFFPDGTLRSMFLLNLGYGDDSSLYPRPPRLLPADFVRFL